MPGVPQARLPLGPALALLLGSSISSVAGAGARGTVELIRDTWGIPHVYADSDEGAMYGLGYATAEDRAFQMSYSLRIIQGRLAEVIGDVPRQGRRETALHSDKMMRTFGFYRAAQTVAENLDAETRALLSAYCEGVNDGFARTRETRHPLFAKLGLEPETWTPTDCIAAWWHLGQFFATDGTRELIAWRNRDGGEPGAAPPGTARPVGRPGRGGPEPGRGVPALPVDVTPMPPDDAPAVVKRADVAGAWIEQVTRFATDHGLAPGRAAAPEGPKFSHAWVVGGKKSSTGAAILVSDPQTPVRNPSLFYEFHVCGKTFNARGIGVPGSPVILIGFTPHVAWGVTALGADQADLFRLRTDPEHPDQYFFDDTWRDMTVRREAIKVRGHEPVEYLIRTTHLGPVATEFCFAQPGEEVALKRVPVCETDRETVQAAFAMMRADSAEAFAAALSAWRFPSANMLFGDAKGNIGYHAVAAIPLRSPDSFADGRAAHDGTASRFAWRGIVPAELLPQVINPGAGYLYSGNHRPIESWYPIPLGAMTGGGGDTVRSWRLRERLEAKPRFAPQDVLDIHYDSVNPARRDIVRLALHLRHRLGRRLSPAAEQALDRLERWSAAGSSSDLACEGAEVATGINTFFRIVATPLAGVYGGGESGLSYFLKSATARLDADPAAELSAVEQEFIDQSLSAAWEQAQSRYGADTARWSGRARESVTGRVLGYYESLDGYPSLDPQYDLHCPPLSNVDGGTIKSQFAQSYTQFVPLDDPDAAMTLLPIGQSERPDSVFRTSTLGLWEQGALHPAPLSREAVARIETLRVSMTTDTSAAVVSVPEQ